MPPSAGAAPWLAVVVGPGAADAIADAMRRVAATALVTPAARPLAFRASASPDAGASADDFRVRVEREAMTLVDPPSVDVGADPVAELVPPVRLLGAILREVPLSGSPSAHGAMLVALSSILAGDGMSASAALREAPGDPGVRLLRAAAALVARDWAAVHTAAFGLGDDRALGPVARVLTGAALRADRNPREAVRDFEAAVVARADLWPARLLAAEAYESEDLALPDRAAAAYEAAARAAPDEPAAAIGHAYYLASKDRAASRAIVDRLLARHPGVAAGWRLLSWLRTQGGTSEDLQASVVALEHVVELQRDDPQAWADLGAARWRWASSGGGRAALLGAAEAFGQQTDRSPDDAGAWFRRGAAIHQAAADTAPMGDATAVRARLVEARTCYGRALTLGLRKEDAARAHFNVGLVTELLPAGTPPTPGVATTASAAFDAALAADPAFGPAAYALVASRIAERDGAAAERALTRAPAATSDDEKRERAVLEAGVAWARGDLVRARALLTGPAGVAAEGGDPVPALARAVFVLGYRRAVLAIVAGDAPDAPRLALRARAYAGLKDVDATREALERLRVVNAAAAADLRRRDPEVTAALGPEVVVGPPAR